MVKIMLDFLKQCAIIYLRHTATKGISMEPHFKYLKDNKGSLSYQRASDNTIAVLTLGHKTAQCYKVQDDLQRLGLFALSTKFDRLSGKTVTLFKEVA